MQNLPDKLYTVDSIIQLEQIAINQFGIPAYELMQRAGEAVFKVIQSKFPECKKILVLCGAGNNAGDGYVVASLAKQAELDVSIISLIDPATLNGAALLAYQHWSHLGENHNADLSIIDSSDLIVDALLGTGLARDVSPEWQQWIRYINQSSKKIVSVDVPSGLYANTGAIAGDSIIANYTVSFIGLKQGMFTSQAKDVCGELLFDDLALDADIYSQVKSDAKLIQQVDYTLLPKRQSSSHKGRFGHVLIVGGSKSMPGAIILAAKAALRTGAGLLTIVTVSENLQAISSAVPEAMIKVCDEHEVMDVFADEFSNSVTHIAVGMGLAQEGWSLAILKHCIALKKPMLLDADALNLLAKNNLHISSPVVITPHPGEAARLLLDVVIQQDRFEAIKRLHKLLDNKYPGVVVLKGSGTLIFDGQTLKVCALGNAAMAAPGMGDVLSGICIALMAQLNNISDATELAVCLHSAAADKLMAGKTRGLLASDIIDTLPEVLQ
ncbi:NAD(P)H-hydrate epimerase / ADP-dependent (S)-NAD(P)H-hydrate dehydratase [hydrothermal vent metagenome]|uniref:Nicotinamide nucleotide repair protein n=1 Tax=hydrothermal vent metagenome TaxID=652676 RepID=A0A3B0W4W8_9ZZZZ